MTCSFGAGVDVRSPGRIGGGAEKSKTDGEEDGCPNPIAVVEYEKCQPDQCENGICVAVLACPTETLKQEAPYEVPYLLGLCRGRAQCAQACPLKAIRMV